jgi:hypothetical protein
MMAFRLPCTTSAGLGRREYVISPLLTSSTKTTEQSRPLRSGKALLYDEPIKQYPLIPHSHYVMYVQ